MNLFFLQRQINLKIIQSSCNMLRFHGRILTKEVLKRKLKNRETLLSPTVHQMSSKTLIKVQSSHLLQTKLNHYFFHNNQLKSHHKLN